MNKIDLLKSFFELAICSSSPSSFLPSHLPPLPTLPSGKLSIVAIGKAAGSMSSVAESHYGDSLSGISGIAIVPDGHERDCTHIDIHTASHPLPDLRGLKATEQVIDLVSNLTKDDLLLFLVSGGGSALLTAPQSGVLDLPEKIRINKALLHSGASISEINIVRKHLSEVKGGQLASMASPARVLTLAISDVPHDDPATIASGPTIPDPTTLSDVHTILENYKIPISDSIKTHLDNPSNETPKPDNPIFDNCDYKIVFRPSDMLTAVENSISQHTDKILSLGADVEGEASLVARDHANLIREHKGTLDCIISGGETSVTFATATSMDKVDKVGKGGRNTEYLLALAIALGELGESGVHALAADTDGIDGNGSNAGAFITPDTLARGLALGMDAQDYLSRHDSLGFFSRLGDLLITGPTYTNVNDIRLIWLS